MDVQWQIKRNVSEANDFIKDLKSWSSKKKHSTRRKRDKSAAAATTTQAKRKDGVEEDLEEKKKLEEYVPPVRGRVAGSVQRLGKEYSQPTEALRNKAQQEKRRRKKKKTKTTGRERDQEAREKASAAGHTYDYFRDKWDKFDVEEALREASESSSYETEEEEEVGVVTEVAEEKKVAERRAPIQKVSTDLSAAQYKTKGNEYYTGKQYQRAVECYTGSIEAEPTAVAFANRAMALLKLGEYERAAEDSTEALKIDPLYLKAFQRRGTAQKELGAYLDAVMDYEAALRISPASAALRKEREVLVQTYCSKEGLDKVKSKVRIPLTSDSREKKAQKSVTFATEKVEEAEDKNREEERPKKKVVSPSKVGSPKVPSPSASPAKVPQNAVEFEITWKSLKDDEDAKWALLRKLDPKNLSTLLKDMLTGPVFHSIIRCVLTNLTGDHEDAGGVDHGIMFLENMAETPRFKINVLSIPSRHRSELKTLWEQSMETTQDRFKDRIVKLAKLYGALK